MAAGKKWTRRSHTERRGLVCVVIAGLSAHV